MRIGIFVGTVYGGAEGLALQVQDVLQQKGHEATLYLDGSLEDVMAYQSDALLVISSTTGYGEVPDNLLPLFEALMARMPMMPNLHYGVIGLGDISYGDERFCGGGRQFDELLLELRAQSICPRLNVDACVDFDPWPPTQRWLDGFIENLTLIASSHPSDSNG